MNRCSLHSCSEAWHWVDTVPIGLDVCPDCGCKELWTESGVNIFEKAKEIQTKSGVCPNCFDDHSARVQCPLFVKLREVIRITVEASEVKDFIGEFRRNVVLMKQVLKLCK